MDKLKHLYLTSKVKKPVHIIRFPCNLLRPVKTSIGTFSSPLFHLKSYKLNQSIIKYNPIFQPYLINTYICNNAPKKVWRTKLVNSKRDIFYQTLTIAAESNIVYIYTLNESCNILGVDDLLINEIMKSLYSLGRFRNDNKDISSILKTNPIYKHPKTRSNIENYMYVYCLVKHKIEVNAAINALDDIHDVLNKQKSVYEIIINKTENFKQKHAYLRKIIDKFKLPLELHKFIVRKFSDESSLVFNDLLLTVTSMHEALIKYSFKQ